MASSGKRKSAERAPEDWVTGVHARLRDEVPARSRIVVALSGGIDSVVLLDVLRRIASRRRWQLSALHVNHQLQDAAPQWVRFCRAVCRVAGVPLRVVKVKVDAGNSIERAAREARYEALLRQPADFIALAHNRDDQSETLMLHLLRGSGIRGLAGMRFVANAPFRSEVAHRPRLLRPLIDVPRSAIEAYAVDRKLEWVEDPTNATDHYTRNYLRAEVMPRIAGRFPAYRDALARAAHHASEAVDLLDDLARQDGSPGRASDACSLASLRRLSHVRAKNVLRHFLQERGVDIPSAERLDEAVRQLRGARADSRVAIVIGPYTLRMHRGAVQLAGRNAANAMDVDTVWRGERELDLPELGGRLSMERARGEGLSLARLASAQVTIRRRKGGERLRPHASGISRTVKNLMQEAGMPAWERDRVPFIYCGERLVCVPGVAIDGAYRGAAREACVLPVWRPA